VGIWQCQGEFGLPFYAILATNGIDKEVSEVSLLRQGKAQVLTIYLGESDQWQGMPLYAAIVQFLREQGCAGATVNRAVAGYGAGSRLHEGGGWHLSSDAPMVIQVIDQPERLQRLLPHIEIMLHGGLMTLHDVEVLKYSHARTHGLPANLPVRQVMETAITTVKPGTPAASVVNLLMDAPFRVLPVIDEQGRLQGIISTGDLINAGLLPMRRGLVRTALELDNLTAEAMEMPLERARESDKTAQDIMNRQVRTVVPDQSIKEAAQIMLNADVRRLPVVENGGKLIGMLSRADLLQAVVTSPLTNVQHANTQSLRRSQTFPGVPVQQRPVADYINVDVATVEEQASVADVIDALLVSPVKRVIVVDGDKRVKGIISDVDVLMRIQEEARPRVLDMLAGWARGKPRSTPPTGTLRVHAGKARVASDLMNPDVVTVTEITPVQDTIEKMIVTHCKVLPVIDAQERLLGVVGRSDLLRVLIEG
jgi:CBS-domain-containing membrane protein